MGVPKATRFFVLLNRRCFHRGRLLLIRGNKKGMRAKMVHMKQTICVPN